MSRASVTTWAKRWNIFLAVVALWIVPGVSLALDPTKAIAQYIQDQWPVDELPQSSILAIAQSPDGYLWLGTQNGLVRFDGVAYRVYDRRNTAELRNDAVRVLLADHAGAIWIGTNDGLFRLSEGTITAFADMENSGPNDILALIEDRRGRIWVGTPRGLSRVAAPGKNSYASVSGVPVGAIAGMVEDRAGAIWFGSKGNGLVRLDGETLVSRLVAPAITNQQITRLSVDQQGNLWIATFGAGLHRLVDGKLVEQRTLAGRPAERINCMLVDPTDTLWVGTEGGGLFRVAGNRLTRYTTQDGLPRDVVSSLYFDPQGSLWIGTDVAGLVRLRDGIITPYTPAEGLAHEQASAIYQDRAGTIWIGTFGGGLSRFKDGKFETYTTRDGLGGDEIGALLEDRHGRLWIGTRPGLSRLEAGRWTAYTERDGMPVLNVWALLEDRQGTLWIGTSGGGLIRHNDARFLRFDAHEPLGNASIRALHEDRQGDLWIGTHGDGLIRMHENQAKSFSAEDGLTSRYVESIYEDRDGAFWLGTYGSGIIRLKNGRFRAIGSKDGLFDDTVLQILEDDTGNFWMCGNRGIFRAARRDLDALADGERTTVASVAYGKAEGMKSPECNGGFQPAGWRMRDGHLWFPTIKGVAVVDPALLRTESDSPKVIIESFGVNHQAQQELVQRTDHELIFPPGSSDLEIHYTVTGLLVPAKARFGYQLEGFDRERIDAGPRRVAYYTNLPPGLFRFRVIAGDRAGDSSMADATFAFRIDPHYYQTTWFTVLCAAIAIAAGWWLYRVRLRLLTARVAVLTERHRIAREIHDTLGQGFAGVSIQLEGVMETLRQSPEIAEKHLDQARSLVRRSMEQARRSVLDLRPQDFDDGDLAAALHRVAYDVTAGSTIRIDMDVTGTRQHLPAETAWHLLQIGREALSNAVRHAQATRIRIGIAYGDRSVELKVTDDGRGFDGSVVEAGGGFGMVGMRERAQLIRAVLSVRSEAKHGTVVTVLVPTR